MFGNIPITLPPEPVHKVPCPPMVKGRGTPKKPTIAPMPRCPLPKQTARANSFDTRPVALTVLEWRYILHALRLCEYDPDGAEEAEMNEHSQSKIEEAIR